MRKNIVHHHITPQISAEYADFPENLSPEIIDILKSKNIEKLYVHQTKSIENILKKKNVVIKTGVASGKSLCYQIPIIQSIFDDSQSRSLLLFPTKALTQDQAKNMSTFLDMEIPITEKLNNIELGVYDGDTSAGHRQQIKKNCNIVLTNPDMLHLGILPHHAQWKEFFKNLKYIVIDEVHIYRGIFGSHFANLIRRVKRICKFYGSQPQFIVTSATISNTKKFVEKLFESEFIDIYKDGAPKGEKHFIIYNPPITNKETGMRLSSLSETVSISKFFSRFDLQSIVFSQSRKSIELILSYLQKNGNKEKVCGYRSGYLATERREIEEKLRNKEISTIVSTNALELGIDIGGLDLIIINGYPGSISSTIQQSGRAGRKSKASLTILVMTSNLLDQYIVKNPEFLLSKNPENALINPNNPYILLQHIQCSVFEKPFEKYEDFGKIEAEIINKYLLVLQKKNVIRESRNAYFWKSKEYPSKSVSFRGSGVNNYTIICQENVVGIVDNNSAFWFTHPEAIYIHNGINYYVTNLDLEKRIVHLIEKNTDYHTQSIRQMEFELIDKYSEKEYKNYSSNFGFLKIISQVTDYKKMKFVTNEILGYGEVDLPATNLSTTAFWFSLSDELIMKLKENDNWNNGKNKYGSNWESIKEKVRERDEYCCKVCGKKEVDKKHDVHHKIPFKQFNDVATANKMDNLITLCRSCHKKAEANVYIQTGLAGLKYILKNLAPVYLMCDRSDIQVNIEEKCILSDGKPTIIFYDSAPGGIGLSKKLFGIHQNLFRDSIQIIQECDCKSGCPACVGPVAENGAGAKSKTLALLKEITN